MIIANVDLLVMLPAASTATLTASTELPPPLEPELDPGGEEESD